MKRTSATQLPLHDIYREISAQFPQALNVTVTSGYRHAANPAGDTEKTTPEQPVLLVQLMLASPLSPAEKQRLRLALGVRAGLKNSDDVQLEIKTSPTANSNQQSTKRQVR